MKCRNVSPCWSNTPRFAGYAAGLNGVTLNRRSVNDGKVTDHHALIVTENLPGELSKDERAVYELVAGRMLEAFFGQERERRNHRCAICRRY